MELIKKIFKKREQNKVKVALRKLDDEINYNLDVLTDVRDSGDLSDETRDRINDLLKLKERLLEIRKKELYKFIDIDELLKGLTGAGVTLLIVYFENNNVFNSKAFALIQGLMRRG